MIEAVDLFCGAGGLTAGLRKAGVVVKAGYDVAPECAHPYTHNNTSEFVLKDVSSVASEEIQSWYSPNSIRLLAGCAPCQPFSNYNQGKIAEKHEKWPLINEFSRLIRDASPDLVTMENVPQVANYAIYKDFVRTLADMGYYYWAGKVACEHYGLPQRRRRHVLIASRLGEIALQEPTHLACQTTVRDAIGDMRPIASGECDEMDKLHKSSKLNNLNMLRMLASRPGGTWKDWPAELLNNCHIKPSGSSYIGVYGRMEWDKPSPTITTLCYGYGNGRFGHPEQPRAISLREAALLQGFPIDYEFSANNEAPQFRRIGRMIGNSVPVRLGEVIGQTFREHVRRIGSAAA